MLLRHYIGLVDLGIVLMAIGWFGSQRLLAAAFAGAAVAVVGVTGSAFPFHTADFGDKYLMFCSLLATVAFWALLQPSSH